jgi:putative hemolysin
VLVFGEVVPKVLGITLAPRLAPLAAALVHTTSYVLGPVAAVIDFLVIEPLHRLISGRPSSVRAAPLVSPEELKLLLEMSRRGGEIDPLENAFLREVIDLSGVRVRDVMVPRVEMVTYDLAGSPDGLRDLMRRTRRRKVPIHEGSGDMIVGLVYAKVRELVQPVCFVPDLATCEQLLVHFRDTRTQLAIALDEYGGVAGLVTLEDVLERIVGDIGPPEEVGEPDILPCGHGEYDVSASLPVHYFAQMFNLGRQSSRAATLGGLVTAQLGRMPVVGSVTRLANLEFEVTRMNGRRVQRVRVRRVTEESAPEPQR